MLGTYVLSDFRIFRPAQETPQQRALEWMVSAHVRAEQALSSLDDEARAQFEKRMRKLVARCACNPTQIASRGHTIDDTSEIYDVERYPHGQGTLARMQVYEREVSKCFDEAYRNSDTPPADIIHVTCTGYVSPSAAQTLVARRGWGERTRVTHAYHMGCYAAIPTLRIAQGCFASDEANASRRVDVMHTELCTLHLDPGNHDIEQIVVQSLFADGCIRYSMSCGDGNGTGLRLIAASERIVPDSEHSMRWLISERGMQMTLARDVPEKVSGVLRPFVTDLLARAGLGLRDLQSVQFAVHPGGPRIIDGVKQTLELGEAQVRVSRAVLFDWGNMSSATLPHVWARMLEDSAIASGTPIVSLAFGPGVTVCGAVLRKQ